MPEAVTLNRFDLKILAHLQREGRCSNVELAGVVGMSESACLLRTKKLQEAGVIRGYGADIALEKLGQYVMVFSEVTIGRHRRQDLHKFEEAVAGHREIVDWYNVSGGYDYLLKIVVPSISCFQELMEHLLAEDIGITKFTSRIVLRHSTGTNTYPIGLIAAGKSRAMP